MLSWLVMILSTIFLLGWPSLLSESALLPSSVVHTPPDKSVVTGNGYIHVVIEVKPQENQKMAVRLNGQEFLPLLTPQDRQGSTFHHYALTLDFGVNSLELLRQGGNPEKIDLFFYSDIGGQFTVPPGFQFRPFHEVPKEQKCSQCHSMTPKETDTAPPSPAQSTCYACHRQITAVKQVHGPAALWGCTLLCHDPTSTPAKYATPNPVWTLCYTCHAAEKREFFESKYQHGPTSTGKCIICHNPHGTDNPFWLKKPPWSLCITCHPEKGDGKHVMSWGPTSDTHPTRGRPDLSRPGAELACSSCHNPHASNAPALWKFGAVERTQFCQACHNK
ncbi:MAG: cytochrome c3 family protein [Candidatus Tectomicrobia bacterium]|nr:cytochrome c3 family protein [Candidatus Tectomicrobia bacterium]